MDVRTVRVILVKELREILRDRRTLLLMIGVPVFLYPALFVLMEQVMLFGQGNLATQAPRVGVHQGVAGGDPLPLADSEDLHLFRLQGADASMVLSGRFDAVLRIDSAGPPGARTLDVQILYDASRDRSLHARSIVRSELDALNEVTVTERLEQLGLPPEFIRPVAVRDTSVATPQGLGGAALGRFLPMVLILMTVVGAFLPAIDIAAGERERRTLEPLLTTSASANSIVIGKYLAVAVIAFTVPALNLASMMLTLNAGIFQFAGQFGLEFELPTRALVLILCLLALLALLFSALFLGVAVQAQSFREAQAALTPIYMVSFLPAIVTFAPGIDFSVGLALLPIAGVAMLFRSLMSLDPVGIEGFIAVGATVVYATLALSFAAKAFSREDVLLDDGGDGESRREKMPWWNREGAALPTPSTAILFAALIAVLYFYFGVGFQRWGEVGILASQWLLLALPALLFIRMGRFGWRETLALRAPRPIGVLASVFIIVGAIPVGWFIAWLQTFFLEIPDELLAGMQGLLTADDAARVAWLLLLVALTPALCEEVVFRGVLLQGFLRRLPVAFSVVASSVVFGLFHLSFETAIRFLPTMFIGVLLAVVVIRTGSIFPAMLMHFINNGTAVWLISMPEMQRYLLQAGGGPNFGIVVVGALCLWAGLLMLPRGARLPPSEDPTYAPPGEPARAAT